MQRTGNEAVRHLAQAIEIAATTAQVCLRRLKIQSAKADFVQLLVQFLTAAEFQNTLLLGLYPKLNGHCV